VKLKINDEAKQVMIRKTGVPSSVPDPDLPDPHVFGPPTSPDPLVRGTALDPDPSIVMQK
jgi:hypothetical protein